MDSTASLWLALAGTTVAVVLVAYLIRVKGLDAEALKSSMELVTRLFTLLGTVTSFFALKTGVVSLVGAGGDVSGTAALQSGVGLAGLIACATVTLSKPGDKASWVAVGAVAVLGLGAAGAYFALAR